MYRDLLQLEEELDRLLYDYGYLLVDLQSAGIRNSRRFRIFIERVDGQPVTLGDCAQISPQIRLYLEAQAIYDTQSSLEVSSAGMDRLLKRDRDFERYLGSDVKVSYQDGQAKKTVIGELSSFTDDLLVLVLHQGQPGAGQSLNIPRDQVDNARLVPQVQIGRGKTNEA